MTSSETIHRAETAASLKTPAFFESHRDANPSDSIFVLKKKIRLRHDSIRHGYSHSWDLIVQRTGNNFSKATDVDVGSLVDFLRSVVLASLAELPRHCAWLVVDIAALWSVDVETPPSEITCFFCGQHPANVLVFNEMPYNPFVFYHRLY